MINNKNIYINPDPFGTTKFYNGEYLHDEKVYSFTLEVINNHPYEVTWVGNKIPEYNNEVEELIKLKFTS